MKNSALFSVTILGLLFVLQILMIFLKVSNYVELTWLVIFAPLIFIGCIIALFILLIIIAYLIGVFKK